MNPWWLERKNKTAYLIYNDVDQIKPLKKPAILKRAFNLFSF